MRKILAFGFAATLILSMLLTGCGGGSTSSDLSSTDPYAQAQAQALGKGVNFGNLLEGDPNEGAWSNGVLIQDSDFTLAKNAGFDSVRLPVGFAGHALQNTPYTIDGTFFQRVDQVVNWGLNAGLRIVIDMHHYTDFTANPQSQQTRFIEMWKQIATRYKDYPKSTVYYELLNEPCQGLTVTVWNRIVAQCIAAIRQIDPNHTIIVDCTDFGNPDGLNGLQIPTAETNAIVSFHYYNPTLFCFQGKSSFMGIDWATTGITWPGPPSTPVTPASGITDAWVIDWINRYNTTPAPNNPAGPEVVKNEIAAAAQWGKDHHRPLWMGEFTAQNGADVDSRARWLSCVRQELEKNNISWSVWTLLSDPGSYLYDVQTKQWITPLTQALGLNVSN